MKIVVKNKEYWFHGSTVNESNCLETKDTDANKFYNITPADLSSIVYDKGLMTSMDMVNVLSTHGLIDNNMWGVYNINNETEYCATRNFSDSKFPWNAMEIVDSCLTNNDRKISYNLRLLKIPKFYYKVEVLSDKINIKLSSEKLDGYQISPAHQKRYSNLFLQDEFYDEQDYIYWDILPADSNNIISNFAARAKNQYLAVANLNNWTKSYASFRTIDFTDEYDILYRPTLWTVDDQMTLLLLILSEFGYVPNLSVNNSNYFNYIGLHNTVKDCNATMNRGLIYHGMQIPTVPFIQDCTVISSGKYLLKAHTSFGEQSNSAAQQANNALEIFIDSDLNISHAPKFTGAETSMVPLGDWNTNYVVGDSHVDKPILISAIKDIGYIDSLTGDFNQIKISNNLAGMQRLVLLPKAI